MDACVRWALLTLVILFILLLFAVELLRELFRIAQTRWLSRIDRLFDNWLGLNEKPRH